MCVARTARGRSRHCRGQFAANVTAAAPTAGRTSTTWRGQRASNRRCPVAKTAYIQFDGRRYMAFGNADFTGMYIAFAKDRVKLENLLRKRDYDAFIDATECRVRFEEVANSSIVDALTEIAKEAM